MAFGEEAAAFMQADWVLETQGILGRIANALENDQGAANAMFTKALDHYGSTMQLIELRTLSDRLIGPGRVSNVEEGVVRFLHEGSGVSIIRIASVLEVREVEKDVLADLDATKGQKK